MKLRLRYIDFVFQFKECLAGRYGYNCGETCNTNCLYKESCHQVTGTCNGGCKDGWSGPLCDTGAFFLFLLINSDIFKLGSRIIK